MAQPLKKIYTNESQRDGLADRKVLTTSHFFSGTTLNLSFLGCKTTSGQKREVCNAWYIQGESEAYSRQECGQVGENTTQISASLAKLDQLKGMLKQCTFSPEESAWEVFTVSREKLVTCVRCIVCVLLV